MRPMIIALAVSTLGALTAACSVHEDRVVAQPPATAAVVTTPAPGAVVYTEPAPVSRTTVTTVR
jgi:hypothetical protein